MKLIHKCISFLVVLAIVQIAVFSVFSYMLAESEIKVQQSRRSVMIADQLVALTRGVQEWASTMVLATISHRAEVKKRYRDLCTELPQEFESVESLVQNNPADLKDVRKAKTSVLFLINGINEMRGRLLASPDVTNILRVKQYIELGARPYMEDVSDALNRVVRRHKVQSAELSRLERDRQYKFKLVLTSGTFLCLFGMSLAVLAFSRGVNKRLNLINDNFSRFSKAEPLNPPLGEGDEICSLDRSFRELARQLEEASEKDRAVFNHLPAGLITCYADGKIVSLNPTAEKLLAVSETELQNRLLSEILTPLEKAHDLNQETHLSAGKYYFLRPTGARCPVELSVSSFRLKETPMLLFAIVDISAKEEVERMKQEFFSIVSHDLQTPLTSIKLGINMLQTGNICQLTDDSRRILRSAERETDRLVRLTKDLLDLARSDAGSVVLSKQKVSAAAIVEQALGAVTGAATEKQIELVQNAVDVDVEVDPDRICQVLVNFLSNAIKYSPANTTVTVEVDLTDTSVVFSVIDQGRGIPADQAPYIFHRFKQVYSADAKKGSGLGLAICKLFAESHGGSVSVESEVGKGSKFMLTVPAMVPSNVS